MVAFVSIVIALSLLGLIVYGLHKYQTMEIEYQVDRSMPLPPIGGDSRSNPSAREDTSRQSTLARKPARSRIRNTPSKQAEKSGTDSSTRKAAPDPNWQEQVAQAKKSGDFSRAYELSRQQFPLWGAFNQACIALRGQLKSDHLSAEEADALLRKLYVTAAIGEMLHEKSEQSEHFKLHQLKHIDYEALEQLEYPYGELGYAQLRLIRKSDVKQMLANWGRPGAHEYPRKIHAQWWESQASKLRQR